MRHRPCGRSRLLSAARRTLLRTNIHGLAPRRRVATASRRFMRHPGTGLAERRDAVEGVKVLPGDPLRVGDPVLFAARIAAGRLAFVEDGHVGGVRTLLQHGELLVAVSLETKVVDTGVAPSRGD